jgi:hypothetical protein
MISNIRKFEKQHNLKAVPILIITGKINKR